MKNRLSQILEILLNKQRIEVSTLSGILGVSQVTIRKDLDQLEEKGLIVRQHGYACLDKINDIGKRMAYCYDIKRRIAKVAAATVEDGETVMIESGSCCALLAEELALTKSEVTIVTNSIFITNYIRHYPSIKIILLGGYYQPESQILVGSITKKCGDEFYSNKFFLGVDGFSRKAGFTLGDHLRVQAIRDLSEFTRGIYILTESDKFNRQGTISLERTDKIVKVFTDEKLPPDAETILRGDNIQIYKVPIYE